MSFTGKATYSAGTTLPELAEDVSDLIGIISPYETPLLDALGDPIREATSIHHEWLDDDLCKKKEKKDNYTQIFTAAIEVSGIKVNGTDMADEIAYEKQERLRGLLRDLENSVINGQSSMKGIINFLQTNIVNIGPYKGNIPFSRLYGFPLGETLDKAKLDHILKQIWLNSNYCVDLIVVGGFQKQKINAFCDDSKSHPANKIYKSDFGICRIVTTRWMPQDTVLFLNSSRISVLPLAGRNFHYQSYVSRSDYECGEIIGEYTLELKNESAHGLIRGLSIS